jgi:sulfoquinovosidase
MIKLTSNNYEFALYFKDYPFIMHRVSSPFILLGYGTGTYRESHGIFRISDEIMNKIPLNEFNIRKETPEEVIIEFPGKLEVRFSVVENKLEIAFDCKVKYINRFWMNLLSTETENIYGCGEQYSELNLKNKLVPLWCEEQGVGRGKDLLTFLANLTYGAGGDSTTTYYPQPTFVSSRNYFCNIETSAYAIFDFTKEKTSTLHIWDVPDKVVIGKYNKASQTISELTKHLGIQPKIADWSYEGVWLGLQGGRDTVKNKLEIAKEYDVEVSALWVQDWVGRRITSFGKQLIWDWNYDKDRYPDLPQFINELKSEGLRFLGYINPFLAIEKDLYKEASEKGYLVKNKEGRDYLITVTTFPAGLIDLSNPGAVKWIKEVIKKNLIETGLSGWMSDFGEYLPMDCVLHSGEDPELFHNKYPVIWAKLNLEAINEAGLKAKDTLFFSRAGYTGTSKYSPVIWAGDQTVNWSRDDGLASVIPAGLSLGFNGIGVHHSDIGGYTTIAWVKRSKELFMRWAEHSAFTVIMRTHEGNRPDKNWQFDSDDETLRHFAKMSKIHKHLKPYIKTILEDYYHNGLPAMRHPYIHYENDVKLHKFKYQYLFGRDLLVAPVYKPKRRKHKVFLPKDNWTHLWSGNSYDGGWVTVKAPLGEPPVFYREESEFSELFAEIKSLK